MPVFHFEVHTPTHVIFPEGMEFADHTAARIEAAKRIGALLHAHAGEVWVDEEWQMDITNQAALILYVLQLSALKAAATAKGA